MEICCLNATWETVLNSTTWTACTTKSMMVNLQTKQEKYQKTQNKNLFSSDVPHIIVLFAIIQIHSSVNQDQ